MLIARLVSFSGQGHIGPTHGVCFGKASHLDAEWKISVESPTASHWFWLREQFRKQALLVWIISAGLVGIAIAIRYLMGARYPAPFIPFYPAILISTLIGGRWIGYCALGASLASSGYLFLDLDGAGAPANVPVALLLFLVVALTVIEILVRLTDLADRLRARELLLIGHARQLAQREIETAAKLAELEAIYQQAPIGLAMLDRQFRFVRINPALASINGYSVEHHLGRSAWDVVPDLQAKAEHILRDVLLSGKPAHHVELSGETAAMPGDVRHWRELFYPVISDQGATVGLGIMCEDITEAKHARERETLLSHEVDHRAKNLLAVIQSVVQLTRFSGDPVAFKASITGRIQALGRVHALLSDKRWDGVMLGEILNQEIAPFAGSVELDMVDQAIPLSPVAAQAISMIFHELLTNSTKYGALSIQSRIVVRCTVVKAPQDMVVLDWKEHGSKAHAQSDRKGFGSKLLQSAVIRTLGGELDYHLSNDGLHCRICFPPDHNIKAA